MLRCRRGPKFYEGVGVVEKVCWKFSDFFYDLTHQKFIREANEAVSPGGRHKTGWYYRLVGQSDPIPVTLSSGERGYAESSYSSDVFQYVGYTSGDNYYHFQETDYSHEHLKEEWLTAGLESGRIVPLNDAPTDLSVLRFVEYG